jgi:uncharacterized membrane protein YjgN (DUF898 family)
MADLPADLKSKGTTVFVLGLLGIVACQILAPIALVMGNSYIAQCNELGVEPDGLGKAGRILGIVGTVLFALGLIFVVLYFVLIFGLIATGALN